VISGVLREALAALTRAIESRSAESSSSLEAEMPDSH
jgi:hypothetical protein